MDSSTTSTGNTAAFPRTPEAHRRTVLVKAVSVVVGLALGLAAVCALGVALQQDFPQAHFPCGIRG